MSGATLYRRAQYNAFVLACAQAIIGSAAPISISLGGLAGSYLLTIDKSLATVPVTSYSVGIALGAFPAAFLMRWLGRRNGLVSGTAFTGVGGVIAALALLQNSFWLFAIGLLMIGCGASFLQQYRFAAADGVPDEFKPKAISYVMVGGIFAAIIGPQIVIHTRDLLAPVMFAGSFAMILLLAIIGAVVLLFFKPVPKTETEQVKKTDNGRPVLEIFFQRKFLIALFCGVSSFSVMSFIMTGAPIAMIGCGFTPDDAALGISWHILAMYAPSFFTGSLIARFGKERIVAVGMIALFFSAVVALTGIELWQFWVTLILLGLGWNFGFIGSTAMLSECYREEEGGKVEATHDFILFSLVAFSSLMAGVVYNAFGWEALNLLVMPIVFTALVLLVFGRSRKSVAA